MVYPGSATTRHQLTLALSARAGRLRNRYLVLYDLLLLPLVVYLSFVLRIDSFDLGSFRSASLQFTILALIVFPTVFYVAGMYSRYWPYAGIVDLLHLAVSIAVVAGIVGGLLVAGSDLPASSFARPPLSVPVIFFMLALGTTAAPRVFARMLTQASLPPSVEVTGDEGMRRTIIVGAGEAGIMTLRELRRNPRLGFHVLGFLDDDPTKQYLQIQGVPVLGTREDLPEVVEELNVGHVIIAMPTVSGRVVRELVDLCRQVGVTPQILPGLYQLIGGQVHINQLRNVEIEDLLRREPIQTDLDAVGRLLRGKRVLVTGAGGSIGSELCRQVLRFEPDELILLGHGENSIFEIQNELTRTMRDDPNHHEQTTLHAVIADFRFRTRMLAVFEEYRPEVVFHAGAHKHVPLMEMNPSEAVTNNVIGTRNVLAAARSVGVERFVFISSDKAVNPSNIMGTSKRVAELLVHQEARQTRRPYMAVRFGNVLGSRGSVVLTMKQQIASGGPVTVTHPDMTRYFMTIPEAVQLVLQASVLGNGGEVFVFDMGEPVKIIDLASDLIRLSGLELGVDIDIALTGVRPGEKLYEELFLEDEKYARTGHGKIFIAANANTGRPADFERLLGALETSATASDDQAVRRLLQALVPHYRPSTAVATPGKIHQHASRDQLPGPDNENGRWVDVAQDYQTADAWSSGP